jgi:amino acid permease
MLRTFLTNINIMIGSGIITLPYMMLQTGVPLGIFLFFFFTALNTANIYFLNKISKELNLQSFADLASVGFKSGATLINLLLIFALMGPIVTNFIVVGDMANSVLPDLDNTTVRSVAILIGAALIFPFCIQKSISQLKIVTVLLFAALMLFIAVLLTKSVKNTDP